MPRRINLGSLLLFWFGHARRIPIAAELFAPSVNNTGFIRGRRISGEDAPAEDGDNALSLQQIRIGFGGARRRIKAQVVFKQSGKLHRLRRNRAIFNLNRCAFYFKVYHVSQGRK